MTVTFTAQGQSADDYIERLVYSSAGEVGALTVVTGDYAQQRIAAGAGVLRMPPPEFLERLAESKEELADTLAEEGRPRRRARLRDRLPEDTRAALERFRRQQK